MPSWLMSCVCHRVSDGKEEAGSVNYDMECNTTGVGQTLVGGRQKNVPLISAEAFVRSEKGSKHDACHVP